MAAFNTEYFVIESGFSYNSLHSDKISHKVEFTAYEYPLDTHSGAVMFREGRVTICPAFDCIEKKSLLYLAMSILGTETGQNRRKKA